MKVAVDRAGRELADDRRRSDGTTELEERIRELAKAQAAVRRGTARRNPTRRLREIRRVLDDAWRTLQTPSFAESRAAEWLLDNAYLIAEAIELVREALPKGFVRWLPRLESHGRERRSLALADELLDALDGYIDPVRLTRLLRTYQETTPLTTAELWALPALLRLVVLERLADEATQITERSSSARSKSLPRDVSDAGMRIGTLVEDLRALAVQDWKSFFEEVSPLEDELNQDPAGAYAAMDFETRDRYRKVIEEVSRRCDRNEIEIARQAVTLARAAASTGPESHVGYYLIDEGILSLEAAVRFRPSLRLRLARHLRRAAVPLYVGAIIFVSLALALTMARPAFIAGSEATVIALLLVILPASALAVSLVNWLATRAVKPRPLPRLRIEGDVATEHATVVVVPALLSNTEEILSVLGVLERNFHANVSTGLRFALLSDFTDAPAEHMADDEALLRVAEDGVRALNRQYGAEDEGPFVLIHRGRRWNPAEGRWMGWERKRGKLSEFNRLVLGEANALRVRVGDSTSLTGLRFAITLDADTLLPPDSARRLIETAAHPLNRPIFDTDGRVVRGYTVLQPRIEVILPDRPASAFARIFEGDQGLDLYSRAVSDVYQDLFAEGSYAGKGLYDIPAFERSVAHRIPENALLSHDLFEGAHGRAALVSDVAVFEDYPHHVLGYMRRLHRWVRGDWQIAPWLLPHVRGESGPVRNRLSVLNRWKIADNLRRSLLEPSVLALLVAGWLFLPGSALWWTLWAAAVPGLSFVLGTLSAARGRVRRPRRWIDLPTAAEAAYTELGRWGVSLALLPYHALVVADAIVRTLFRLVTRRHLLEWTSAASVAHDVEAARQKDVWRPMLPAPLFGVGLGTTLFFVAPASLAVAAPFLVAWLTSPWLAWRLSRPGTSARGALSDADRLEARRLARRTWAFFETILGPEDHWLPVDHVQEEPHPHAARRTSPTNIGLGAAAALAAWDLGYVTTSRLSAVYLNMFDALDRLERHRGHFLNWYDTHGLTSLRPRYVSTVDSGNLACALISIARGCDAMGDEPIPRPAELEGLRDSIRLLREAIEQPRIRALPGSRTLVQAARDAMDALPATFRPDSATCGAVARVAEHYLPHLESLAADLAEAEGTQLDAHEVGWLRTTLMRARQHATQCRGERLELLPWSEIDEAPPDALGRLSGSALAAWQALRAALPSTATLQRIPVIVEFARDHLRNLETELGATTAEAGSAGGWIADFAARLEGAAARARDLTAELRSIAERADAFVTAMDFRFLYDAERHLFRIGYDVDAGRLDRSYYDLLTSEARLASYLAIATGAVPVEHWLRMARPFSRARRHAVMLSWGGTMFEYLLPALFLRTPDSTLVSFACDAAVREQRDHARRRGLPWGVSESAFHQVDRHGTYQYRAFGVPTLALKRETIEYDVVAPYASALALSTHGPEVMDNLRVLADLGGLGRYGMYESIDFGNGSAGVFRQGQVVRSYMAHHQAMILLAIDSVLTPEAIVRRFHADARVAAVEHLVLERLPREARLEPPPLSPARTLRPRPPVRSSLWRIEPDRERPQVQVLSNGRWSTLITDRGSGNARWRGKALTRWRADAALDDCGTWLHVQDLESGASWSPTSFPNGPEPERYEVLYAPHRVEFRGIEEDIATRLTVLVPANADVEVRRLTVTNAGTHARHLAVTSFGEIALSAQADDVRHASFNKLSVESRYLESTHTLLFNRRNGDDGSALHLAHTVLIDARVARIAGWETDRARFIGRDGSMRRPSGLARGPASLSRTVGATLDPAFALGVEIELPPGGDCDVIFLTAAGRTGATALAQLEPFRSPVRISWAMREARDSSGAEMGALRMEPGDPELAQALLSALVFPYHALRVPASDAVRPRQDALWGLGVSSDHPIIAVRVASNDGKAELTRIVRVHAFLRRQGVQTDLLVLAAESVAGGYAEPLGTWLRETVQAYHGPEAWHQTGGVFYVPLSRLDVAAASAIAASAAVCLDAESDVFRQLEKTRTGRARLPRFVPVPSAPSVARDTEPLPRTEDVLFDNGLGGFTRDGREYVIRVEPGRPTPTPWINVIANPEFGFTVSEGGGGFTWAGDSGRHRLTPWRNDPVRDAPGEVVYLRDEETGDVWSATPRPAPGDMRYEVHHGAGYTRFAHRSHGLDQRLRLFVPIDAPLKIAQLEVTNQWPRQRRLTVTYYVEWVLGETRDVSAPHVVTELAMEVRAVLAQQHFSAHRAGHIAFLAASEPLHGATGDRSGFLGRGGLEDPAGLECIGLDEVFGSGHDPCAAVQIHLDLGPGEKRSVHFLLGEAEDRERAVALITRYRATDTMRAGFDEVQRFWEDQLSGIRVETPEPSMDLLLNHWLPYQALACRMWARSALYQSSGAFGYRDQLQDALAFLMSRPEVARQQILEAAARQFAEGDVLHWWHPGTMKGVRTRCSDDLLWLPFALAAYVEATGDAAILREAVSFLEAPPLSDAERERYDTFAPGGDAQCLYEHGQRAIVRGLTRGVHGLPLMGANDWNDGFDHVGDGGRGESVWLGWFLHVTLTGFAALAESVEGKEAADAMRSEAERLRAAIEAEAWDGAWYRRAYYDDGSPLGSAANTEAKIDSISQSWAALSDPEPNERARQAMIAVRRELLDASNGLLRLLAPPFDRGEQRPGYIRAYPPGVRENGAQYTHAAVWAAWAFAQMEAGGEAEALFRMLNPVRRALTPEDIARYRVEPYVVAADIYSVAPHTGRGGWTWYTGSAAWLYRFGVERVLGLQRRGMTLYVDPRVPADWKTFSIIYRTGSAEYDIRVEIPAGGYEGVEQVKLDGRVLQGLAIPLEGSGTHGVTVRLGARAGSRPWSPVLW